MSRTSGRRTLPEAQKLRRSVSFFVGVFGGVAGVVGVGMAPSVAFADPLRLRADAYAQTSSSVGLLVVRGEDRAKPWFDAEGVAWVGNGNGAGNGSTDQVVGDALTLTFRLRDPGGRGEVRFGRFVLATGALRPVHVDGARALGRWLATKTTLETFYGAPVAPRLGARPFDLFAGVRAAQGFGDFGTIGLAYAVRRRDAVTIDKELGPDLAFAPARWLDLAARASFDLVNKGPTDAFASLGLRSGDDLRFELFGTRRSPSRLLSPTSLFSVLGDLPSTTGGATIRLRAAPRLELMTTGSVVHADGDVGGSVTVRATLALDDGGPGSAGSLGVEARRQYVGPSRWVGARVLLQLPLSEALRVTTELELVRPDAPTGTSHVWPWALVAAAYRLTPRWSCSLAGEAMITRDDRRELFSMLRVGYAFENLK